MNFSYLTSETTRNDDLFEKSQYFLPVSSENVSSSIVGRETLIVILIVKQRILSLYVQALRCAFTLKKRFQPHTHHITSSPLQCPNEFDLVNFINLSRRRRNFGE